MLKFLTDIHISSRSIAELKKDGIDILRSLEVGFVQETADDVLFAYAVSNKRVMVTYDTDFLVLHGVYLEKNSDHYGVLYFNMNTGECGDLGLIVKTIHFLVEVAVSEDDLKDQIWRANQ